MDLGFLAKIDLLLENKEKDKEEKLELTMNSKTSRYLSVSLPPSLYF